MAQLNINKESVSSVNILGPEKINVPCSSTSRSATEKLNKDKDRIRKEAFHNWLKSKNLEKLVKKQEEQKLKKMIEEQTKIKKETAELCFALWKHEKTLKTKANKLEESHLKEELEQQKTLKQQASRERVSHWMSTSKHKPRPVPSNMGLLSLTGSNPPSFFNPRPWIAPV